MHHHHDCDCHRTNDLLRQVGDLVHDVLTRHPRTSVPDLRAWLVEGVSNQVEAAALLATAEQGDVT